MTSSDLFSEGCLSQSQLDWTAKHGGDSSLPPKSAETADQRGNRVATAVWNWLKEQQSIQFVPWVLDPENASFDQAKLDEQQIRDTLLSELEQVILEVSHSCTRTDYETR